MAGHLVEVRLNDFRNHEDTNIRFCDRLTILVGANGVGKTNVLEAIDTVLSRQSFRRVQWADLVRWGAEKARVVLKAAEDARERSAALEVTEAGTRSLIVDGETISPRKTLPAAFPPSVVFTPDDLQMVKGPAEQRRAALDAVGERLSKTYGSLRREYERTVRQRNAALRDESPEAVVSVLSERVADTGARLVSHRKRLLERISSAAVGAYEKIAEGQCLSLEYSAGWIGQGVEETALKEALRGALESRAGEERARGITLAGPHRDDVRFLINGREARSFASQGQQRTAALAWKLAEVQVIEQVGGKTPALLLDDVMSELDERRRHALASIVDTRVQTIATTTDLSYFDPVLLQDACVVGLD